MAAINYKDHLLWQQKGKIEEQSEQVQAVFNFINSEKGQAVIKQVKLIIPQK